MRFIWLIFGGLLVIMAVVLPRLGKPALAPARNTTTVAADASRLAQPVALRTASTGRADSIVAFGLAQQGTPYVFAGTSPLTGFDCSGFIMYTFAHFGVPVPHSTALLIDVGRPVARSEAQQGDIVVFTGTATTSTTPGHAGIVISRRGEVPLRFVHASSSRREPFVKVSQVEDSDYERRFMQVRRVLGPGTGMVTTARPKVSAPLSMPSVATIRARPVAIEASDVTLPALPEKLVTKKSYHSRHPAVSKKKPAKPSSAKKATSATKRKAAPKAHPKLRKPAIKAHK